MTALETVEIAVDRNATEALESMLLIRTFEEKSAALQAAGQAPIMCTFVGQEASAVGVVRALGADDLILTNHRSAGPCSRAAQIPEDSWPRSSARRQVIAAAAAEASTSPRKSSASS